MLGLNLRDEPSLETCSAWTSVTNPHWKRARAENVLSLDSTNAFEDRSVTSCVSHSGRARYRGAFFGDACLQRDAAGVTPREAVMVLPPARTSPVRRGSGSTGGALDRIL